MFLVRTASGHGYVIVLFCLKRNYLARFSNGQLESLAACDSEESASY